MLRAVFVFLFSSGISTAVWLLGLKSLLFDVVAKNYSGRGRCVGGGADASNALIRQRVGRQHVGRLLGEHSTSLGRATMLVKIPKESR